MTLKLLATGLAITLVVTACNRNDDNPPVPADLALNTWKYDTKIYSAVSVVRNTAITALVASTQMPGNDVSQFYATFQSFPAALGSYKITGNSTPDPDQMRAAVLVNNNGVDKVYEATGSEHADAIVTIVNGKIQVRVPSVWAKRLGGTDSIKIAANIIEL